MSDTLPHTIVYSCTFGDYDYTFGPLAGTPNTQFLRFGTTRPNRWRIWEHHSIPAEHHHPTQTLTNRRYKLFPAEVLPPSDVAIYIDGNILVRRDLAPIIREFWESGADIALFAHPSRRTLGEEMDFALRYKIPASDVAVTEEQRDAYREMGLLDQKITENTIIFYRMNSPKVAQIGRLWWNELERYCKRDQISLPYVLYEVTPKVHRWDWHFHHPTDNNPYFARSGHRPPGRVKRAQRAAHFMKDYSWEYRALYRAFQTGGVIRNLPTRLLGRSKG